MNRSQTWPEVNHTDSMEFHILSHFYVKKKVTHISNRLTVYRNVAVVGSYIVTFDSLTGGF